MFGRPRKLSAEILVHGGQAGARVKSWLRIAVRVILLTESSERLLGLPVYRYGGSLVAVVW
jgi:hypothetical protein